MKLRPGIPAGVAEVYPEDEDDELAHFRHVVPPEGLAGPVDLSVHRAAQIEQTVVLLHEVEGDGGIRRHVPQHLSGMMKSRFVRFFDLKKFSEKSNSLMSTFTVLDLGNGKM